MFIPVLLVFTVKGMGFDSCIAFCANKKIAEFEKKGCFCRTQWGMDVSEYKYLFLLDYRLVKMCLKGDENKTNVGVL